MGEYALLTEVYGSDLKPKKQKKKHKKTANRVIEPDEMDRVLLEGESVSPEVKVKNLRIDPHDDAGDNYEDYFRNDDRSSNRRSNSYEDISSYSGNIKSFKDDPEYKEFLEYKEKKRNKLLQDEMEVIESKRNNSEYSSYSSYSTNDRLNELMLYIFTGFFVLLLFDNIYKLGKKSY
jgi:hypothetical protein